MLAVRPYVFEREFDASDRSSRSIEECEEEIARLEARIEEVREEGRAAGAGEALARFQSERETALLAAAEALAAGLARLDLRFEESEQAVARLGASLALDLADHLAGRALARDPAATIDVAIGRALKQVRRGQPLQVRIAPGLAGPLQSLIDQRQQQDRRRLKVSLVEDPCLPAGDARIEWEGGCLLLDQAARRAAMEGEVTALLGAAR